MIKKYTTQVMICQKHPNCSLPAMRRRTLIFLNIKKNTI